MFPGAYGNKIMAVFPTEILKLSIIRIKILMQKFCIGTKDGCGFLFECQSALYSSFVHVGDTFPIEQLALIFVDYLLQCCMVVNSMTCYT